MSLRVDLPYEQWLPTKETLHRFAQIVGKVRLAHSPRRNHWWNVPFHVTGSGITTRPMGSNPVFAIDLDFIEHRAVIATTEGSRRTFPLEGQSVASFHAELVAALTSLGIDANPIVDAKPFDLPDAARAFADDTEHAHYDPDHARAYWRILSEVSMLLEEFSGRFAGKTSPVHHFWHTFDIAATRFSDAIVEHEPTTDPVTREAYSREVISFGFWFGDPSVPYPAFYAYVSPEPDGVADRALPDGAEWLDRGASHLAIYPLETAKSTADPRSAVLDFWEAAYRAGAELAGWDLARHACVDGATDPFAAAR
jgi:hypothetical protein